MDALRTLEILITSRTPFIAIETLEEDRVEQALERVAQRLRIPLFVWTMTRGLRRAGALEPLYDTREPLKALRNLSEPLFEAERALTRAAPDDLTLGPRDIEVIAQMKKEILSRDRVLDCVPEKESLEDVGGLHGLKAWLEKRRDALTPEARKFGVEPPRGILLLGVQGCGKSLAAKAVAKTWSLPLLRLEPGRLFDGFIGESEKNLDRALATAERMAPCVLMIDEIEKGFEWAEGRAVPAS
jgi:SpoVK/Ycf46/Vps4 family AAA+-type ATPase